MPAPSVVSSLKLSEVAPRASARNCARALLGQVASGKGGGTTRRASTTVPSGGSPGPAPRVFSSFDVVDGMGSSQLEARIAAAEAVSAAVRARVSWALAAFSVPIEECAGAGADGDIMGDAHRGASDAHSDARGDVSCTGHSPVSGLRARGPREAVTMFSSPQPQPKLKSLQKRSPSPSSLQGGDLSEAVAAAGARIALQLGDASRRATALVRSQLGVDSDSDFFDTPLSSSLLSSSSIKTAIATTITHTQKHSHTRCLPSSLQTTFPRGSAAAEIQDAAKWFSRRVRAASRIQRLRRRFVAARAAAATLCAWMLARTSGAAARRFYKAVRALASSLNRLARGALAKRSSSARRRAARSINRVWRGALARREMRHRLLIFKALQCAVAVASADKDSGAAVGVGAKVIAEDASDADDDDATIVAGLSGDLSDDSLFLLKEPESLLLQDDHDHEEEDEDLDSWGDLRPPSSHASFRDNGVVSCCDASLAAPFADDVFRGQGEEADALEAALLAEALAPSRGWGGGRGGGGDEDAAALLMREAIDVATTLAALY